LRQTKRHPLNAVGGGRSSQNEYVTSLYSPDSYATAKIKILGDPDFLVQEHRGGIDSLYQRFYGDDGFRVTANGGQVFIEIDFKEAIDYNGETGVMDLNDSILFFRYPTAIEEQIKGVSYKVITIDSTFSDGKFTQELSCAINTFSDPPAIETSGDEAGAQEQGESENNEGNDDT
jgi:hypothetical protein